MSSLRAHFDGRSVVFDEPASLAVGQRVRVIVESVAGTDGQEGVTPAAPTATVHTPRLANPRDAARFVMAVGEAHDG